MIKSNIDIVQSKLLAYILRVVVTVLHRRKDSQHQMMRRCVNNSKSNLYFCRSHLIYYNLGVYIIGHNEVFNLKIEGSSQ